MDANFFSLFYDRFILGMERNTENGIQIFGKTIGIYSNSRFGRSCLHQFGDPVSVWAQDISGYW